VTTGDGERASRHRMLGLLRAGGCPATVPVEGSGGLGPRWARQSASFAIAEKIR
jgi:hypothetical protein